MFDTFYGYPKTKTLIVKNNGLMTAIAIPGKKGSKAKLIDIAFGSFSSIVNDLMAKGYAIKVA